MNLTVNKKICFISHNATRTGAPIVLYTLLKFLKLRGYKNIEVLFVENGDLFDDFNKLFPSKVLKSQPCSALMFYLNRIFIKATKINWFLKIQLIFLYKFNILFFNTIASFKILNDIPLFVKSKKVLWIHEQPYSIKSWYSQYIIDSLFYQFQKIYCVSNETITWLVQKSIIDPNISKLQRPFIDLSLATNHRTRFIANEYISFKVGSCGLQDWRKGPDLFLQLAHHVQTLAPLKQIQFEWVGKKGNMNDNLEYEIEKRGLGQIILFQEESKNIYTFLDQITVFILTSREDPYPLVVLEAASMGLPVICFDKIGDIVSFVSIVPENVIPYGRVDLMAERLLFYYFNRDLMLEHGKILKSQVSKYYVQNNAILFINDLFE
jgi:glycosyltransferase involved in cell wall biosynthesis